MSQNVQVHRTTGQPSRFLQLPVELRNMVYEHYLELSKPCYVTRRHPWSSIGSSLQNIMLVSKDLHEGAGYLLVKKTVANLTILNNMFWPSRLKTTTYALTNFSNVCLFIGGATKEAWLLKQIRIFSESSNSVVKRFGGNRHRNLQIHFEIPVDRFATPRAPSWLTPTLLQLLANNPHIDVRFHLHVTASAWMREQFRHLGRLQQELRNVWGALNGTIPFSLHVYFPGRRYTRYPRISPFPNYWPAQTHYNAKYHLEDGFSAVSNIVSQLGS